LLSKFLEKKERKQSVKLKSTTTTTSKKKSVKTRRNCIVSCFHAKIIVLTLYDLVKVSYSCRLLFGWKENNRKNIFSSITIIHDICLLLLGYLYNEKKNFLFSFPLCVLYQGNRIKGSFSVFLLLFR
jgi:hypothetical protein